MLNIDIKKMGYYCNNILTSYTSINTHQNLLHSCMHLTDINYFEIE